MNQWTLQADPVVHWVAAVVLAVLVLAAGLRAPWRALLAQSERQHALFATLLLVPLLWALAMDLGGEVRLHLLAIPAVLLIFGWELAVLIGLFSGLALLAFGQWRPEDLAFNSLLTTVIPVLVTQGLLTAADRLRRTNLFVYLLGVGFGGGFLSMTVTLLLGGALLGWETDHAMVLLLAFPEGFLDGAVVTALTVFYPRIMRTYDDVRYLGEP